MLVAPANSEMPEGVIFVLKNRNNGVNIDSLNRIHPFYMVYIGVDGEIICDYLNPKKLLDNTEAALPRQERADKRTVYKI